MFFKYILQPINIVSKYIIQYEGVMDNQVKVFLFANFSFF